MEDEVWQWLHQQLATTWGGKPWVQPGAFSTTEQGEDKSSTGSCCEVLLPSGLFSTKLNNQLLNLIFLTVVNFLKNSALKEKTVLLRQCDGKKELPLIHLKCDGLIYFLREKV